MKAKNWSLTTQLGVLFACISAIAFSVLGIYLYQALAAQLQARDDAVRYSDINGHFHLINLSKGVKT